MMNKWINSRGVYQYGIRSLLLIWIMVVLSVVTVPTAKAQYAPGDVKWSAQFYNNRYLLPPEAFTRQDREIQFNWGSGSPVPGVNADNFTPVGQPVLTYPPGRIASTSELMMGFTLLSTITIG